MTTAENFQDATHFVRKRPPGHYLLKIESFSVLKDKIATVSNGCCFESSEFMAAGHKWLLSIHLKGNKKDGGDGHISIYSKMTGDLNSGSSVNIMILRFFIYDCIKHNYYVMEVEKCFDAKKTEGGLSKLITQDAFYNPSNGYLINDRCAFGVEIFGLETTSKFVTLSLMHKPTTPTYTWNIYEFSKLPDHVYSPTFTSEGCIWKLSLYPEGDGKDQSGKYLSLYLAVDNSDGVGKKALVEYELCLKNQLKGDQFSKSSAGTWFTLPVNRWGWRSFLALSELNDPLKGYKVDDVVIVEVTIISVFMLRES